jgi:hypothetical protein
VAGTVREYGHRYPLEVLDNHLYPNLRRDASGRIISENLAWFVLRETMLDPVVKEKTDKMLVEIECKVKEYCSNAELAYQDISGNRWVFILLASDPSKEELKQMQRAYEEMQGKFIMC